MPIAIINIFLLLNKKLINVYNMENHEEYMTKAKELVDKIINCKGDGIVERLFYMDYMIKHLKYLESTKQIHKSNDIFQYDELIFPEGDPELVSWGSYISSTCIKGYCDYKNKYTSDEFLSVIRLKNLESMFEN
jgi:hypothetical protein